MELKYIRDRSYDIHFLKVFPSRAIYPLHRLISWNFTTRCLTVTGGVILLSTSATYYSKSSQHSFVWYNKVVIGLLTCYRFTDFYMLRIKR